MTVSGWLLTEIGGSFGVLHSSGWYVSGFDSKADAALWLHTYLMAQHDIAAKREHRRERLLAQMDPHGRVPS